jgi:hypothetical protein
LGVQIDEHFSWTHHIHYICGKLRILLSKFYHLSFRVPRNILKCIYVSLVDSIMGYALDCYGLATKTNIQKLEALQIRFLKLLVNKKVKNSCQGDYSKLFRICKILPVSLKHKFLLLINNRCTREHDLRLIENDHNTRSVSTGRLYVPRVTNYFGDRMLKKRLPYYLNSLPMAIRQEQNFKIFKNKLRMYLLSIC